MKALTKSYYILFCNLYAFFEAAAKEGWEHWKAFALMCVLQVLIILQSLVWYTVLTGTAVAMQNPFWIAGIAGAIITTLNYYALLQNDKWKYYKQEFGRESKSNKRLAYWLSFLFVFAVFTGLILSFVFLSRTFST